MRPAPGVAASVAGRRPRGLADQGGRAIEVSLGLPTHRVDAPDEWCTGDAVAEMARAAEDAGFHAVYVTDHPAPDVAYLAGGGHHAMDPFVVLTVAAAATRRVRLHTNLVILAYRNPFTVAKAIASLDVVSGGRVVVGTGAGYLAPEFAAVGGDFEHRNTVTDESIRAMRAIWSGEPVTMEGRHFSAVDTIALPLPVQRPGPPIWIGGNSDRAIRRAVELADGWNPMPATAAASRKVRTPTIESVDDLARRIGDLRAASEQAGRAEPPTVVFTPFSALLAGAELPDPAAFREEAAAYAEVGVGALTVSVPARSRAEWLERVARFGADVVAHL